MNDDGTLKLEGQLKGTYDSPVVVVVRVDLGGTHSSANISQPVTPADLDGKPFVYTGVIGSWAPGEEITCQENVNPASDTSDYGYTAITWRPTTCRTSTTGSGTTPSRPATTTRPPAPR